MPHLLQLALFAREFDDVIHFTRPTPVAAAAVSRPSPPRPLARLSGQLSGVPYPPAKRGYRSPGRLTSLEAPGGVPPV